MNAHVLDTSALIGAWVRSYPPDSFPNFWINMDAAAQEGRLLVPHEVYRELERKQDELLKWARDRQEWMLAPTSRAVMEKAREILGRHPGLIKPGTAGTKPIHSLSRQRGSWEWLS